MTFSPKFKVGDIVSWTNSYGAKYPEREIIGVEPPSKDDPNATARYLLSPHDAPWMSVMETQLMHDADDPVLEVCGGHKIRNIDVDGASWFLVGTTKHCFAKMELARNYAQNNAIPKNNLRCK